MNKTNSKKKLKELTYGQQTLDVQRVYFSRIDSPDFFNHDAAGVNQYSSLFCIFGLVSSRYIGQSVND